MISPASRFVATEQTAYWPTQIGKTIYTKIERSRNGLLGPDLTWRTALGVIVRINRWCFYVPLFFWRKLV